MKEIKSNYLDNIISTENSFLLLVYTSFCGTCNRAKQMLEIIEKTNSYIKIFGINGNKNPKIIQQFKIQSIPCFLLFKNGELIDKFYAFYSIRFLYDKINQLIS